MGSVGSVQFQILPCSSLYLFSRSIGLLQYLVNVNYRILICFTCHFQSGFLFLFILASSVCKSLQCLSSTLTQGVTSLGSLVSCVVGREGHCNVTGVWGERSPCMGHTGSAPVRGSCAFPVDTAQAPGSSAGRCPQWALRFLPFPGLCSRSGSRVLHKGTDLVGRAFCALPRSEQLRRPGAW